MMGNIHFEYSLTNSLGKSPSETTTPGSTSISFLLLISPEWTRISLSKLYQHVTNTLNNQGTITMIERSHCVRANQTESGMKVSNGSRQIELAGVADGTNKLTLVCELGALTVVCIIPNFPGLQPALMMSSECLVELKQAIKSRFCMLMQFFPAPYS
jgi:hypothetical protein